MLISVQLTRNFCTSEANTYRSPPTWNDKVIENILQINSFRRLLQMLASSVDCHSAKQFADALDKHRTRRDKVPAFTEREVQRWMQPLDASVPKDYVFHFITLFLEHKGKLARSLNDPIYGRLVQLYHEAREKKPSRREASKQNTISSDQRLAIVSVESPERIFTADTLDDLASIISTLPHTKQISYTLSGLMSIGSPYDRGALQEKFATLILECKGPASERHVSKVCANALANVETWTPSAVIVSGLEAYCNDSFSKIQETTLSISRALSFALARAGYHDSLQRKIDLFLSDRDLYEIDSQELDTYYGSYINQVLAVRDHLNETHRKGVMRANDTSRLLRLKERVDGPLRELVVDLLRQSGAALIAAGLDRQGFNIIDHNLI